MVEQYLVAHRTPGGVLDGGVEDLVRGLGAFADAEANPHPTAARSPRRTGLAEGVRIGPYKLLAVLGEGGMGTVWLAEQTEPIRRRVAIKVIKLGMDTEEVIARFESERQALAVMDHPSIATVLDAGVTDTGQPFFAMEYVKGVDINEYCDTDRLSVPERVHLFQQVCGAVQHAHQKAVIHRDLKPSNVLVAVTEGGGAHAKVIDFGVAKAVGGSLTDRTLVTTTGQMVGTPAYMSPEQAERSGLDVDTRTDVYSLGVMLFELLAGALPFGRALLGKPEMLFPYLVRETELPKPSTRFGELSDTQDTVARERGTDVATLRRELSGDLDWIVIRAMAKDRTRRYETASELSLDLGRYKANEPVLARPPQRHVPTEPFRSSKPSRGDRGRDVRGHSARRHTRHDHRNGAGEGRRGSRPARRRPPRSERRRPRRRSPTF